jgi:hypothetical protein
LTYLMDGDVATAELILAANLTKRHVKMKCARRGAAAARAALLSNILSVREADRVWSDEGFLIDYDERMLPSSLLSTIRARTLFEISIPACHPLGEAPSSSKPLAVYEVLHLSVSDYRCLQHQITATMQTLSSAAQAALVNSCSGRPRMIVSLAKAAAALAVLDEAPVVSLAHIRRVLDASK